MDRRDLLDGRRAAGIYLFLPPPLPQASRLCQRCLAQGVVEPADPAAWAAECLGHLTEDRINDVIRGWGW